MYQVKCDNGEIRLATELSLASVIFAVLTAGLNVIEIVRA